MTEQEKRSAPKGLVSALIAQIAQPNVRLLLVAPPGFGKANLVDSLQGSLAGAAVCRVDLARCGHHPGLWIDHLVRGLRRSAPGAWFDGLLALKTSPTADDFVEGLVLAMRRMVELRGWTDVLFLFENMGTLQEESTVLKGVHALVEHPDVATRVLMTARRDLPYFPRPTVVWGPAELALGVEDIRSLALARGYQQSGDALARQVHQLTDGWPVPVAVMLDLFEHDAFADWRETLEGVQVDGTLAERVSGAVLAGLGSTQQYVARVVSVLDALDLGAMRAMFVHPSSGQGLTRRGRIVRLREADLEGLITDLIGAHVLSEHEGAWRLNTWIRQGLRTALKREDPDAYREANRRIAEHLLKTAEAPSIHLLRHLFESGQQDAFMGVVEKEGNRLVRQGHHQQLALWMDTLQSSQKVLPMWANFQLAHIYSLRGSWEQARAYLDRCKGQVSSLQDDGERLLWPPRINRAYAVMCARRGMYADARTYCRRGLDYIRQVRRRSPVSADVDETLLGLQLGLLDRLGTNKYAAGLYEKAWDVCFEFRELATARGRQADEHKALIKLGTVAHLKGALTVAEECFAKAFEMNDQVPADPIRRVELLVAMGWNYLDLGLISRAEELLLEASERAEALSHWAILARVRLTLGVLYYLTDRDDESRRAMSAAWELHGVIGNLALRGEVLDWGVIVMARLGDKAVVLEHFRIARRLIGGTIRAQQPLVALHKEAEAAVHLMEGGIEQGVRVLESAVKLYEAMGGRIGLMRCHWHLAWMHQILFVEGRSESPERVFEHLGSAIETAISTGLLLPVRSEMRELLEVGQQFGGPEVVGMCAEVLLERFGMTEGEVNERWNRDGNAASLSIQRHRTFDQLLASVNDYWVLTRREVIGLTEEDVEDLQEESQGGELWVHLAEQRLDNFGVSVSLAQKRVILPLLVHFLMRHDEDFTMGELAQHVWGAEELDNSMRTKVKVAISRLRSLLGKRRNYIVTGRRHETGKKSEVTYALAPRLEFRLVGLMGDANCPDSLQA